MPQAAPATRQAARLLKTFSRPLSRPQGSSSREVVCAAFPGGSGSLPHFDEPLRVFRVGIAALPYSEAQDVPESDGLQWQRNP
jgi:hypothetical protein